MKKWILVFLLLSACTSNKLPRDSSQKEPTPTPMTPVGDEKLKYEWNEELEAYLQKKLKEKKNIVNLASKYNWVAFFKALAKAESNLNPYTTYWESTLGSPKGYDPHTKMKYLSEGFFQLSYSDALWWKDHCKFDIEGDRNKDPEDKTKTIFIPERQIDCAVHIMEVLLRKGKGPIFNSGHYWYVLKPSKSAHKRFLKYYNQYK